MGTLHQIVGNMDATAEARNIRRMKIGLLGSSVQNNTATLYYEIPNGLDKADVQAHEGRLAERLRETIGGDGISISNFVKQYGEDVQAFEVTLTGQSFTNFTEMERTSMKAEQAVSQR